jgi:hypothetical protein
MVNTGYRGTIPTNLAKKVWYYFQNCFTYSAVY